MVSEDKCLGGLRLENSQDQDEKKKIDKLGSLRALRDVICFVRRGT